MTEALGPDWTEGPLAAIASDTQLAKGVCRPQIQIQNFSQGLYSTRDTDESWPPARQFIPGLPEPAATTTSVCTYQLSGRLHHACTTAALHPLPLLCTPTLASCSSLSCIQATPFAHSFLDTHPLLLYSPPFERHTVPSSRTPFTRSPSMIPASPFQCDIGSLHLNGSLCRNISRTSPCPRIAQTRHPATDGSIG